MKKLATLALLGALVTSCGGSPTSPAGARGPTPSSTGTTTYFAASPITSAASSASAGFAQCLAGSGGAWCHAGATPGGTLTGAPPPNAPSNFTATSSGANVTLTWSAPSGGDAVQQYVIEAGSASGLSNLATVATGSTATTFSASGVASGTYYVRVRASNSSGTGAASNEAVLIVGSTGCTAAPGPPGNLSATATGGTVVLTWTAATGTPTSYVIEAGSATGLSNLATSDLGSTALTYTATGVGSGTYFVRIRAKNACGTGSASNEFRLVVGTTTTAAVTVTSVAPTSGSDTGGTPVTITGSGFKAGATVTIGGTAATNVSVVSATSMTATTSAHAGGAADVVVTNPDSQSGRLALGYTYASASRVVLVNRSVAVSVVAPVTFVVPSTGTVDVAFDLAGTLAFVVVSSCGTTVSTGIGLPCNAFAVSTGPTAFTVRLAAGSYNVVLVPPQSATVQVVIGFTP